MKTRHILLSLALTALVSACSDRPTEPVSKEGTLSFDGFTLEMDDELVTKATAASGSYTILIFDENGNETVSTTYSEVKTSGNTITLPAGSYTLVARSSADEAPASAFELPVYSASADFNITAGKNTALGTLTCTLSQCKVTVSYTDEFLSMVTGNGNASVSVTAGSPLDYQLTYGSSSCSYDTRAGYFAINNGSNTTMEVTFKGSIDGKSQKMSRTFTGIAAKQWRHITFTKKLDTEGNATFDIIINDFVSDADLTNLIAANETIIDVDPSAPVGDGGITLESTCSYDISEAIVVPALPNPFTLTMKATIPNKVKKFEVEIQSDSDAFINSVGSINDGQTVLDLVNPSEGAKQVFTGILPFPYGNDVYDKSEIDFNLSDAQEPLLAFPGNHTFVMRVTDQAGCKKEIPIVLIVK